MKYRLFILPEKDVHLKTDSMPSGKVILKVPKDKDRPKVDDIFGSLRYEKTITVKAVCQESRWWRPQGFNLYEVQVISINLLNAEAKKHGDCYIAKGVLVSMNGKQGEFPTDICRLPEEPEYPVEIHFSKMNRMSFCYTEYLTL